MVLCGTCRADDGAAEIAGGGLQLRKQARISVEKEQLNSSLRASKHLAEPATHRGNGGSKAPANRRILSLCRVDPIHSEEREYVEDAHRKSLR